MSNFSQIKSKLSDEQASELFSEGGWQLVSSVNTDGRVEHVLAKLKTTPSQPAARWCTRCFDWKDTKEELCPDCRRAFIPIQELHLWSRHTDVIQWTVVGFLLAASGAIYFRESLNFPTASCGATLVLFSLIVMENFRRFRTHLQLQWPPSHREYVRNPCVLKQWHFQVLAHGVFAVLWLDKLVRFKPDFTPEIICVGAIAIIGSIFTVIHFEAVARCQAKEIDARLAKCV